MTPELAIRPGPPTGTPHRILYVSGNINLSTSATFLEKIRVETAPVLILDLNGVGYADSSGVGALAQLHKSFQLENRRLVLVGLTRKVRLVLEITHVLELLTVFATQAEAETALRQA